ncbi:hypothetical protein ARC310_18695 [Pantoea ananatis]|nr:hypothetical protein ARC310_18695 [Pantoea ananatis]PZD60290.1 hypothetical protein ARC311_17925 [Pantoea ananatis]
MRSKELFTCHFWPGQRAVQAVIPCAGDARGAIRAKNVCAHLTQCVSVGAEMKTGGMPVVGDYSSSDDAAARGQSVASCKAIGQPAINRPLRQAKGNGTCDVTTSL